MKISITFSFPIKFGKIKNGEIVVEDVGPAEPIVNLLDGDIKGESPLQQVKALLDAAVQGIGESKRRNRQSR